MKALGTASVSNVVIIMLATVLASLVSVPVNGQFSVVGEAKMQPAVDGILAAFQAHPLVGLADRHGFAQIIAFYEEVIQDPRFAQDVRNVVVEFGGARHQAVIDRYTNGSSVSYEELRRVWTDTVGWSPTIEHLGYAHFFA